MKCPACHRPQLRHVEDRVTGGAVKDDGRFLLRCEACGDVRIVARKELNALKGIIERPGLLWWIGGAIGLLVSIAEALVRASHSDPDGPVGPYGVVFVFAWILLGLLKVLLQQLKDFKESEQSRERFEIAFSGLLILAFAVFMAWLGARVYLDYRADQKRFTPAPPAVRAGLAPDLARSGPAGHTLRPCPRC
ncbi:MAG: hypothetical protein IT436_14925 [Phycisphaerales bacterium]|nr:hypothetical protein [Phycisphaerales bacterium]